MKWEKWRWNEEYGIFVSNFGHFRDKDKEDIPIKIINTTGYVFVRTKYGARPAHRLVMLTWKPIPDRENYTVDHLDHNKRNNAVDNLEWVTAFENMERAKKDSINAEEVTAEMVRKIKAINENSDERFCFQNITEAVNFVWNRNKQLKKTTIKQCINKAILSRQKYENYTWNWAE